MVSARLCLVGVTIAACGRINYDPLPWATPDAAALVDVASETPAPDGPAAPIPDAAAPITDAGVDRRESGQPDAVAQACPSGTRFGEPAALDITGLDPDLYGPRLAGDGLHLFLSQTRGNPFRDEDIWTVVRDSPGSIRFAGPVRLEAIASAASDGSPFPTRDGLELYFTSARGGSRDLWAARRGQTSGAFADPLPLFFVNSDADDQNPSLSDDGEVLFFASNRDSLIAGREDIFTATRGSRLLPFARPTRVAELSGPGMDGAPFISPDGLAIYFTSDRAGGRGGLDVWAAIRPTRDAPFSAPSPVFEVNSPGDDEDPSLSADGRELFLSSNRAGRDFLIYRASRCP